MGKIIGITGGIASGKSTVTEFLRQKGFQVVDADAVVHQLQKPGGRLFQILVEHFGEKILLENGELKTRFVGGKPYYIDRSLSIYRED